MLTGGLGAGKTTATQFFRARGATVICLDEVARHALAKGTSSFTRVVAEFGDSILAEDGSIDRQALADVVFSAPGAVERLNAIVHPEVAREVGMSLTELRLMPQHGPEVVVVEVPLLAEAPVFAELADEVVAIVAPAGERADRATRRGLAHDDAQRRIAHQASDEQRAAMADVVISNDGALEVFEQRLAEYWDTHVARSGAVGR